MNIQALFFDFDGVILDTVIMKSEAYSQLFITYGPEIHSKVYNYCLANGGISRKKKLKHCYEVFLNSSINEEKINELSKEFTNLVLEKVLKAPFLEGVLETLETAKKCRIPCYIISGTPDEEMKYIVRTRNLDSYFEEIHGSPRYKDVIIKDILDRKGYKPENTFFLGDAIADYNAAIANGINFIGIVQDETMSPFPEGTIIRSKVNILN